MQKIIKSKKIFIFIFFAFSFCSVFSQNTLITGKIIDEKNIAVSGATIKLLELQKNTISDVDGRFTIEVNPGKKYTLEISAMNFATKQISDIDVTEKSIIDLTIVLESQSKNLENVIIKTTSRKESTNSMILFQKNTNVIAQVISAESIRRSPDKNTGEALKRATGLSIQDGRYLVVRGLSDRYNQAMLNGILLSSTEPDRKSFAFDIFPSAIVENIVINKTFIPEYSAEWAGGLIQITTREIPSRNFFNIQIGTNFNTNTIGKNFALYNGGNLDWIGFDDGTRALPNNFPTKSVYAGLSGAEQTEWAKPFAAQNWSYQSTSNPLNTLGENFQINGGFATKLFHKDFGGVITVSYNRSVKNLNYQNSFFNIDDGKATPSVVYENNKYSQDILWGALANFSLKLDVNNKITFRNLFNVNTSDYTTLRTGKDYEANSIFGENIKAYEFGFKNNTFFNTQINGEHRINAWNSKFNWFGSFIILDQYIPQQRRLQYNQSANDSNAPYLALLSNTLSQKSGNIYYANLNDYIYNLGGDLTKTFKLFGNPQTIKAGYIFQVKDRMFDARPFSIILPSDNPALRALDPSIIFSPENFGTSQGLFQVNELTGIYYRYMANSILNAGYIQLDNTLADWLRIVWGVRYENFDQLVGSPQKSDPRYNYSNTGDFLPAVNATFKLKSNSNFRVSASQTLVRPEFRELTGTAFYDFEMGATVIGNSNLVRTKISNFDLRYEIYPHAGELITLGVFYKHFQSPIELSLNQSGAGSSNTFNYLDNKDTKATSYGIEFEFRKKLLFIEALKNFTLQGNFSYIYNRIKFSESSLDRPMQGQSPYLLNAGLQYDLEKWGLNTTLLFNEVGRRILYVGNEAYPSIWEAPRPLLDLQLAKKILKNKAEIKLNISDILNQRAVFYHDLNYSKQNDLGDAIAIKRNYGTNVSINFSFNF
ncbi:MAG: TonB-dependent receptor [Bacteroidetes bacterium]|nr:TonB-dependent receptor [Bacteroidota bacterium]